MKSTPPPGRVMLDLAGPTLAPEEKDKLRCPAAGGIILFARNYESPEQIAGLIAEVRAVRPQLLVGVDQEGGRVQRFRAGFTRLPPAVAYSAVPQSESAAETAGWLMAAELRAVDVDFSFAPVLDVDSGISTIIGDRAFGSDPATVSRLALAFARGMRHAGMAAVGKHFPGHGGVAADSHLELPVDPRPLAVMESRDLAPFRALIGFGVEAIMPAHVVYAETDERPAGFSPFWIREVLRRRLGFEGTVFSDDLSMAGAASAGGSYPDRARMALEAGCDMVLVCNAAKGAEQVLDAWASKPPDLERSARLERLRGRGQTGLAALLADTRWRQAVATLASFNA